MAEAEKKKLDTEAAEKLIERAHEQQAAANAPPPPLDGDLEPDLHKLNQRLYKSSVMILGWWKLASVLVYLLLFYYTINPYYLEYSRILMALLRLMLLAAIVGTLVYALVLLSGAFFEDLEIIKGAPGICIGLGVLDLFLGLLGFTVYISGIYYTINFIIVDVYLFILVQLLWTLCYDLPQIIIFKQLVGLEQEELDIMISSMSQEERDYLTKYHKKTLQEEADKLAALTPPPQLAKLERPPQPYMEERPQPRVEKPPAPWQAAAKQGPNAPGATQVGAKPTTEAAAPPSLTTPTVKKGPVPPSSTDTSESEAGPCDTCMDEGNIRNIY